MNNLNLIYNNYYKKVLKKIKNIIISGKVNYWNGKEGFLFEKEFSKYHGNKYSIAVSNGSVALEIALKSLNLKKGDKVIVTPRSFIISASCVLNIGLVPIFADIDENGNLNIDGILNVYEKAVKAIIIVHLNGLPCDIDPIIKFTKKKKIFLIEDCSQAHGAIYKNKKVGSFGDVATWSFCTDKIISTGGEGGMISTNNKKIWQKCWSIKDHGKNYKKIFYKKNKKGYQWLHDFPGSNYRLTEIQSVIGRLQLKNLNAQLKLRNKIAYMYINSLKDFYIKSNLLKRPNFYCGDCPDKNNKCNFCLHSFYRLNLYINKKKINNVNLIEQLKKQKIQCMVGSCPEIYRERFFKKNKIFQNVRLKNAELLGKTSIVFPINPKKSIKIYKKEMIKIKNILKKYI